MMNEQELKVVRAKAALLEDFASALLSLEGKGDEKDPVADALLDWVQRAKRAEAEAEDLKGKLSRAYERIGGQSEVLSRSAERAVGFTPGLLRRAREAASMTQSAMADHLGVTRNTIINWEAGRTEPSVGEAGRIGELLGCPVSVLFGGEVVTRRQIEKAPLFRTGKFLLHSGEESDFLIDCCSLTEEDWRALALLASQRLPAFGRVEGVPEGGLPFAEALRAFQMPGNGTLLICEDVLTTGMSIIEYRNARDAIGVAAFARGPCPEWVVPLFTLSKRKK